MKYLDLACGSFVHFTLISVEGVEVFGSSRFVHLEKVKIQFHSAHNS